jgi:hypothetical protein
MYATNEVLLFTVDDHVPRRGQRYFSACLCIKDGTMQGEGTPYLEGRA